MGRHRNDPDWTEGRRIAHANAETMANLSLNRGRARLMADTDPVNVSRHMHQMHHARREWEKAGKRCETNMTSPNGECWHCGAVNGQSCLDRTVND